jgi:phosphonate transport system substrate-binding protein
MSEFIPTLKYDTEFQGSTQNVIKNVLLQKADAGVTLNSQLAKEPPDIQSQIRILERTPDIPSHPLSAHPRVPQLIQDSVRDAVLALNATPAGAELLREIWLGAPVAADYQKDFGSFEKVDIKKLSDWGE